MSENDFRFNDAKGPSIGTGGHSFCSSCNRVIYNVWKYGPVTPARFNSTYCTCSGEWKGWDAADIKRAEDEKEVIRMGEELIENERRQKEADRGGNSKA